MTYFAAHDEAGRVTGYYPENQRPAGPHLELTDEQWQAAIELTDAHVVQGAIVSVPPAVDLGAYAARLRWSREVGGITVAGVPVATDDRAKLMITGARVAAMADPGWSTVWHGADGLTYPVDAAAMIVIGDAVQAHVNSGFAIFATVRTAIDAGEITTTSEIDAAFAA